MASYRDIDPEGKVSITADWLNPKRGRPDFENTPALAANLEQIQDAHNAVSQAKNAQGESPALKAAQKECADLDGQHDRWARVAYFMLRAAEDEADQEATQEALVALRTKILFPKGLGVVRWSYAREAAEVEQRELRTEAQHKKLMKQVTLNGRTLLSVVESWNESGKNLGIADKKKTDLKLALDDADNKVLSEAEANKEWVNTVTMIEGILARSTKIPPEVKKRIWAPVEKELRKAKNIPAEANEEPIAPEPTGPAEDEEEGIVG